MSRFAYMGHELIEFCKMPYCIASTNGLAMDLGVDACISTKARVWSAQAIRPQCLLEGMGSRERWFIEQEAVEPLEYSCGGQRDSAFVSARGGSNCPVERELTDKYVDPLEWRSFARSWLWICSALWCTSLPAAQLVWSVLDRPNVQTRRSMKEHPPCQRGPSTQLFSN